MLKQRPHHLNLVLPVLVHIEAHLDGELSTRAPATRAGLSPAHFHCVFRAVTGETVKRYTLRVRLERAAYRLLVEESQAVAVAMDHGFRSHEVFTRAFRRHFGTSPSAYRAADPLGVTGPDGRGHGVEERLDGCELSETRARVLRPTHVAFLRQVGPYEQVDGDAWATLQRWAEARGLPPGTSLGVGHDAPGVTAPERLRFDACIEVPGPMRSAGAIGYQLLAGGAFAVTTHVGPFRTLGQAHHRIYERASRLPATAWWACRRSRRTGARSSTTSTR